MPAHSKLNLLRDAEDQAARYGHGEHLDARFVREALECATTGLSLQRIKPGHRVPFGHRHRHQEELYVVVRGTGHIAIEDEVLDLTEWDVVRVAPSAWRTFEAGTDGLDVLAFGAPAEGDPTETEMRPGWWPGG